jgi:hypothetical protein
MQELASVDSRHREFNGVEVNREQSRDYIPAAAEFSRDEEILE